MRNAWILLAGTYLGAGAIGYQLAPREILDNEVKQAGFFTVDTKRVLSSTVDSLRDENKLLVFAYKGSAFVSIERTSWWIFGGRQELLVPAAVNYYLDMSQLTLNEVTYDEHSRIVTVRLPPLIIGDIAFQPELARFANEGLWSDKQIEELTRLNYAQARKAVIKQAQGPAFVQVAQAQATTSIQNDFEIPLRIAGRPDVKVVATFDR